MIKEREGLKKLQGDHKKKRMKASLCGNFLCVRVMSLAVRDKT